MVFVKDILPPFLKGRSAVAGWVLFGAAPPASADISTSSLPALAAVGRPAGNQGWNWHVQNTDNVQGYPGFPAKYSGPNIRFLTFLNHAHLGK